MTAHISVDTGCNMGCSYSLSPEQRVLTSDLEWKEIQNVSLGDELASFENPDYRDRGKHLKLVSGEVTKKFEYFAPAVRVKTDKSEIVVGEDHKFLSKHHGWREAQDFKTGQEIRFLTKPENYEEDSSYQHGYIHGAFCGDGTVGHSVDKNGFDVNFAEVRCRDEEIINHILEYKEGRYDLKEKEMSTSELYGIGIRSREGVDHIESQLPSSEKESYIHNEKNYKRGWLAGLFDTDGAFDGTTVRFCQNEGNIKETIASFLDDLGYNYVSEDGGIRVSESYGGKFDILSEIRPKVSRKVRSYEGNSWKGQAVVEEIEHLGRRELHDVTVEPEHTIIAEGLMSHQCYETTDRIVKGNDVTDNYDMDAIMERLEEFKQRYPQEVPGLHGGEPLLLRDEDIETIFEWIYNNYEQVRNGEKYSHIQTNGTLINDKHLDIFAKYNVHVGISCDGPPELNEERIAANGAGDSDELSKVTNNNIFKIARSDDVSVGVIVVAHKTNAGDDEKIDKLLDWMDDLNQLGVSGHFNEMLEYDEIQTQISLEPEQMKHLYLRTWEWMKEESYRTWNPMRQFQDNLLGVDLGDCRVAQCDPFDAGAAKIIDGEGETSGCFDSETELLTKNGWINVSDITSENNIATVDPENWQMEFSHPTAVQKYDYEGELYSWNSGQLDITVTPDHKMLAKPTRAWDWSDPTAEELSKFSEPTFKPAPHGKKGGREIDVDDILPINNIGRVDISTDIEDWMDFLGWYISEGYAYEDDYRVTIAQDSDHTEEVIQMLSDMGFRVHSYNGEHSINSKEIYQIVEQFGLCDEKYVPAWIKELTPELIERFLKVLMKGDGYINDGNWVKYTTTSERLADDVQELLLCIGKGANKQKRKEKTKGGKDCYDITITNDSPEKSRFTSNVEKIKYSGKVYDVTLPPYHTVVTRRNGKTSIHGQCGKTWQAVGDGTSFLQGPSNGSQYNDDQDRETILKQLPGAPETDGPDLGGCKGCRYWKICNGGCPSAGIDQDHRNRTMWCESKYYLYKRIEEDMRQMFPNIRLVTDLPWDADIMMEASNGKLDIGQFAAMDPSRGGSRSVYGGHENDVPPPQEMVSEEAIPERSQEQVIDEFREKHGEENVTVEVDGDEVITHADSDMTEN